MLLSKMRSGIFSYLFLGFLLFAGVGLVLTDWTGTYGNLEGSSDIAEIDGDAIRAPEFDALVRRVLKSEQMDAKTAYRNGTISQILDVKIMDGLMQRAAYDYGIVVEDKHVAREIAAMLKPMVPAGSTPKETLARLLQAQGMRESELVDNLRSDTATRLVRESITLNYYVPGAMASDLDTYRHEQRTAETVFIPLDANAPKLPDDKTIEAYFNTIKAAYTDPESRSFTLAVIDPAKLGVKTEISDDEIKAYYNDNLEAFKIGERRTISQTVVDTPDKADAVLKLVKSGKSLEDATKTVTGSVKNFIEDSPFDKADLPKPLADPVFAAKLSDYVGPVQSPLGWHVVFVKAISPPQTLSLAEAGPDIRKELASGKQADQIYAATSAIDDRLNGGEKLEDLAKEHDFVLVTVARAAMTDPTFPALKDYEADQAKILQAAFSLQDGETSSLADLGGDRMFAVRLDTITPKRQKPLAEVRTEVEKRWSGEELKKANAAYVSQALKKLQSGQTTLVDIAGEKSSRINVFSALSRDGTIPDGLSEANRAQLMSAKKDAYIVMPGKNGILIGRVTGIKVQDKPPSDEVIEETRVALGRDASQENLQSFVNALRAQYRTTVNDPLLKKLYDTDSQP